MNPIERRIDKIEAELPALPCRIAEHEEFHFLFYGLGEEQDRANDAKLEARRQCERCRVDPAMCFILAGKGPGGAENRL